MDTVHLRWTLILVVFFLPFVGCGQQQPASNTTPVAPVTASAEKSRPTVVPSLGEEQSVIPPTTSKEANIDGTSAEVASSSPREPQLLPDSQEGQPATTSPEKLSPSPPVTQVVYTAEDGLNIRGKSVALNERPFTEAQHLPDELIGLVVVHPQQIIASPIGEFLRKQLDSNTSPDQFTDLLKLFLEDIDRIAIPIDKSCLDEFSEGIGLSTRQVPVPGSSMIHKANFSKTPGAESLSEIQGAFQEYHDTWGMFPRADGDGKGRYRGLSWRVHLLPFLGQNDLYDQFHLDEPWESKHNKALISKMPDVFKSPGVTDEGKTAYHVVTGEGTYFSGSTGYELKPSEESTEAHRLLVVLTGTDTADFWTKPGGREFDAADVRRILGEKRDEPVLGVLASGSVHTLPADMSDQLLSRMVLLNSSSDETEIMLGLEFGGANLVGAVALPDGTATGLQQIGIAMAQYAGAHFVYPRADGDGPGLRTGLSWRVHLLPFLGEEDLYHEFHLDEAWDSEHNKTLISRMPGAYRVPDVKNGETSYHVFTGENTLFHGEWGFKPLDIKTVDPILVVQAGPDTADVWTKPGGLAVDFNDPVKCLGQVKDEIVAIGQYSSYKRFPVDIAASDFANAIRPIPAGTREEDGAVEAPSKTFNTLANMIITLNKDVPKTKIVDCLLDHPDEEQFEGQPIHADEQSAVWFPDARTVVMGSIEKVKQIISSQRQQDREKSPLIELLKVGPDVSFVVGLESILGLVEEQMQDIPMLGAVNNVKAIDGQISLSAKSGDSLMSVDFTMVEPEFVAGLFAIANVALTQGRMMFGGEGLPVQVGEQFAAENLIAQLVASAKVEIKDDKMVFSLPIPGQNDGLPVLLKNLATGGGVWNLVDDDQYSSLSEIGAGFQNFEETFGAYPGDDRQRNDQPSGLSWRVHLLPFVGEPALYRQFKLNEPWDSEHNKALIEKMPDIFKSPGVAAPGKTSMHILIGKKSPFADHRTPQVADFGDDQQNSILMVVAGADKAEIWTKPGGLDFDPKNPIEWLGKSTGPSFMTIRGDGSMLPLDKATEPTILNEMIQPKPSEHPQPSRPRRIHRARQAIGIDFEVADPAF